MENGGQLSPRQVALIRAAIEPGWRADTSWKASIWIADRPSTGQCAVTSMLVQDVLGGDLVHTTVNGIPHFFNRLPSGQEIDLTRDQFDPPLRIVGHDIAPRSRLNHSTSTVQRYQRLRSRVGAELEHVVTERMVTVAGRSVA